MALATELSPTALETEFQEHARIWYDQTRKHSFVHKRAIHQRIIGLGPSVVRMILRELEKTRDHWLWALQAISGEDPAKGIDTYADAVERWLLYNCIAWAAGNGEQWWQPTFGVSGFYWPEDLPEDLRVETFCELYRRFGGYEPCSSTALEAGFEKIALYADDVGDVAHVARQLANGHWTSKLGALEDIEHVTAEALEADYGKIACALKRSLTEAKGEK